MINFVFSVQSNSVLLTEADVTSFQVQMMIFGLIQIQSQIQIKIQNLTVKCNFSLKYKKPVHLNGLFYCFLLRVIHSLTIVINQLNQFLIPNVEAVA